MKTSTAMNKQRHAINRLKDIFSTNRIYKNPAKWETDQYLEVVLPIIEKCPQWVKSYVQGFKDCLYEVQWQYVEFCYKVDGVWYTTLKSTDNRHSNKPNWRTLSDYNMKDKECCYMWLNTEKPYTPIAVMN